MKINQRFTVTNKGFAIYQALCARRGGASMFDAAVKIFDSDNSIDHAQFVNDDHRVMYISKIAEDMLHETNAVIMPNLTSWKAIPMQEGSADFPEADSLKRQREDAEKCIEEVEGAEGQ